MFHLLSSFSHGSLSIGGLAWLAFVIWMLIDAARAQENFFWFWLILVFQPIGPIAYFLTHKLSDFTYGRRFGGGLWSSWSRLRKLKADVYHLDQAYHWAKLGEEYLAWHNWSEAARCFEEALKRNPQTEEAIYGLGKARLAQGRWQDALDQILPLVEPNARYDHGAGLLRVARAFRGLGRNAEALEYYRFLLQHYTYSEARYEYASLLYATGATQEGLAMMQTVRDDGRNASGFNKAQERRWGRKAGRFLRTHRQ